MRLFRRAGAQPNRDDIRRAIPKRSEHVEVEQSSERTTLRVPLKGKSGLTGWIARRADSPSHHEIELDEIGTFVWGLCDGKHTVAGIAGALSKQYKITKHEAEASMLDFVDSLRRRGCLNLERK